MKLKWYIKQLTKVIFITHVRRINGLIKYTDLFAGFWGKRDRYYIDYLTNPGLNTKNKATLRRKGLLGLKVPEG